MFDIQINTSREITNTPTGNNGANSMNVSFTYPETCDYCGFHNFKINGVVYNENINHMNLKVRCMNCGKIKTQIKTEKEDNS